MAGVASSASSTTPIRGAQESSSTYAATAIASSTTTVIARCVAGAAGPAPTARQQPSGRAAVRRSRRRRACRLALGPGPASATRRAISRRSASRAGPARAPPRPSPPRPRAGPPARALPCSPERPHALRSVASQLPQQPRAGVAGLLRVELGRPQRRRARPRPRTARRASAVGDQRRRSAAIGRVRVDEVEARSPVERRRTAPSRPAASTVFQPMCGSDRRAAAGAPSPGSSPRPLVTTPCSSPASKRICMPTQMPEHRPAGRDPVGGSPGRRRSRRSRPCRPRTPRRRARPARRRRPARSRSAVTVTSAPARASARSADRRLPDP